MAKLDVPAIRQAAQGRWPEILLAIGGVDRELLDGKHHPCPKCGGEDRFRMIDQDAGALFCNQCFASKNGDGFAALQWLLSVDFPAAAEKVADYLGVKATKESSNDPAKDLEWQEWNSQLVAMLVSRRKGISEQALLDAGARRARYKKNYAVIALPVIGESLDVEKPVGWALVSATGTMLPRWDKSGNVVGQTKVKLTYGTKTGLIGVHGIERIKAEGLVERIWKTEGVTDMLAVMAAIPDKLRDRHAVVTNAQGAQQKARWMAGLLATSPCYVLHDADEPGQAGAAEWVRSIAEQGGEARNVVLPHEVQPTKGKDVRDWLNEGSDYEDLVALGEKAQPIEVKRTESGDVDESERTFPVQELILKKLKIEVVYESKDGRVRIFSWHLRKSSWLSQRQVAYMNRTELIQICGGFIKDFIVLKDPREGEYAMEDVRDAIATMAAQRRGDEEERGVGIWQAVDGEGSEVDTLVLVDNTEAAIWNGSGELERVRTPRTRGLVLDFGSGQDWYDFETTSRKVSKATSDRDWVVSAIQRSESLFGRWRWGNQEVDPLLVTGLVLSTWVQTIWHWRPLVAIVGESNSGKSYLFEALGGSQGRLGIFGRLAFKQAKSTEAGIRQGTHNKARVILCDEFEKSREREKVLEALRSSTRGEKIARGTSGQAGNKEFHLCHIGWVAAIEAGLNAQPDANRFIQLDLLKAKAGAEGRLVLPNPSELQALGQDLLGIAVANALPAKQLAAELKSAQVPGVEQRLVETFAVPAAMLSTALGNDERQSKALLADLMQTVDRSVQGTTDHESLLDDIVAAQVNCGARDGFLSVGQIIESQHHRSEYGARMEAQGVAYEQGRLIIAYRQASQGLLRGMKWDGQQIDKILMRVPGAARSREYIAGRRPNVITLPYQIEGAEDLEF